VWKHEHRHPSAGPSLCATLSAFAQARCGEESVPSFSTDTHLLREASMAANAPRLGSCYGFGTASLAASYVLPNRYS